MALKIMRLNEQPCMEDGVQVHEPGELWELDYLPELGGRLIITGSEDA
jgi:hypothetical protein